jgi:hypothetical protein
MTLLANARMYSVSPAAKAAWRTLIEWAAQHAAVPIQFVEHEPPLLLSDLWSREDLGIVQMCGLPASLRDPSPTLIAAPIPTPTRYAGRSVYMSDLAVHVDSPFQTLADTFGGTAGYTLKDSQSGYFAFRYLLLDKYPQAQYKKIVGHLMNARGIIKETQAVLARERGKVTGDQVIFAHGMGSALFGLGLNRLGLSLSFSRGRAGPHALMNTQIMACLFGSGHIVAITCEETVQKDRQHGFLRPTGRCHYIRFPASIN